MKYCPVCHQSFADDSLNFCLQDGTLLSRQADYEATKVRPGEAPATAILAAASTGATPASPLTQPWTNATQPVPRYSKSSKAAIVILSAMVLILLIALVGGGAWIFFSRNNGITPNLNQATPGNANAGERENRNSQLANANNRNANTNSYVPSFSSSPTPIASPVDVAAVRQQVVSVLNGWTASVTARDLDAHMSYYADRLSIYYRATDVSSSKVRSDTERAFSVYSSLDIRLTNVRVTSDPTGQRATAVFDKTYSFSGEKTTSGSVEEMVLLSNIGGRWRITGEKEMKIYYVTK
jgi:hypothetical protein